MAIGIKQVQEWKEAVDFCKPRWDNCPLWNEVTSVPCPKSGQCRSRDIGGMVRPRLEDVVDLLLEYDLNDRMKTKEINILLDENRELRKKRRGEG
jgi:hypothetical protein